MNQIALYEQARTLIQTLATADDIDEVKNISDMASAMTHYARMAHDPKLENWVAEIRLRARRRIGELSAALPKATGANLPNVADPLRTAKREVLKLAGIGKDEAHRCEQLARVSKHEFESYIAQKKAAGTTVTADEVVKAVAKQTRKRDVAQRVETPDVLVAADLSDLATRGMKFGTIYADPPWLYDDQDTRGATSDHYRGMTVSEIAALPVSQLASEKAHLHLWTTNAFLFEARDIMQSWGFEYKSCFVWVKPSLGVGHYWRVSHEFLLLGVRGGCTFADRSLKSWGEFERRGHSVKPPEVRRFIEAASPGQRLELFGRRPVPGWVVWGNEIEREAFNADVKGLAA
jgi:N6-adenosine-specific RNA methylase IME4/Tfp pilus assembly protein PilP